MAFPSPSPSSSPSPPPSSHSTLKTVSVIGCRMAATTKLYRSYGLRVYVCLCIRVRVRRVRDTKKGWEKSEGAVAPCIPELGQPARGLLGPPRPAPLPSPYLTPSAAVPSPPLPQRTGSRCRSAVRPEAWT